MGKPALVLVPMALVLLLVVSVFDVATAQQLFVHGTYYLLLAAVLCWLGMYCHAARALRREVVVAWLRENWPGVVLALAVTFIVARSIEPGLRMLSDEANLVGTSKNLFASKTATFTVSGKNYYDSYWDIDVIIDRRPTLFPFLVSLLHAALGYSHTNAFTLNLLLVPAFVLLSYRVAKTLGGETFGAVAALLVVAHPMTLLAARSGGFDFLALVLGLFVLKSALDYLRSQTPTGLALLWLNLCLFAEVRYESGLFMAPVLGLLLAFRLVDWQTLYPYRFLYAVSPAFLLPRAWQWILRGNVPEQEAGAITFSLDNFLNNVAEYFAPLLSPTGAFPSHAAILLALGVPACLLGLRWLLGQLKARELRSPELRFALLVTAWMLLQTVISFTYVWGRAQHPSAARLVIAFDTFFSFAAAWLVARMFARWGRFVPLLLAAAIFLFHTPVAAQHRMMNRLTQTRESASLWRFFERLNDKRILIVTDRPNHFTIMNYGAMSFASARRDPHLFKAFESRLFQDVYVIQPVRLSTGQILAGYELWPERKLDPVLEFQNDADVLVRVSRLAR